MRDSKAIKIIEEMAKELRGIEDRETYTERHDRIDSLDEIIKRIKKANKR